MRARHTAPAIVLSPELRQVLLYGPHTIGKTLHDFQHDMLRELWRLHGPTLLASQDCPREPWFPARDEFVSYVRTHLRDPRERTP